ncbi:MAG: SDR family oxidoreductase [Clostridiales bacterium]|nr:SDR family oxidoreductase [Clostridiales bacterium]
MEKVIVITGASSDIGMAYINENAQEYSKIIAHYHHESELFTRLCHQYEGKVLPIQADFGNQEAVQQFVVKIEETGLTPTHILHLASPVTQSVKFHKSRVEEYQFMMQVSVYSIVEILRAFLPAMQKQKFGRILLMLSAYVEIPDPRFAAPYVTAKYALLGLMKDVAAEYAAKGITVNGISPQMMETKFLKDVPELIVEQQRLAGPLRRLLQKEDILPMMRLLLSDEAAAVTGENIGITGGNHIL